MAERMSAPNVLVRNDDRVPEWWQPPMADGCKPMREADMLPQEREPSWVKDMRKQGIAPHMMLDGTNGL